MIAKITGGASFGGALAYLMKPKEPRQEEKKELYQERLKDAQRTPGEPAPAFEAGERHRVIGGNLSGDARAEMSEEFRTISKQRPDIEKPVHHASLSAGEKDRLTVEQWNEIAERYIEEMGFKDCPYVVIQHRDGNVDHIHILSTRVDTQGKVVSVWKSKERAQEILRAIEKDYGLERVKSSREVERAAPKRGEIETFNRTGRLSAKMELQGHVEVALKDAPTATEFIERLQVVGVETIPYLTDGRATGVSSRKDKQLMKGSNLGRGFSWNALQDRGLDYNQERDRPAIEAARLCTDAARTKTVEAPALNAPALSTPTISTPLLERGYMDIAQDVGSAVGQYVLDQINPVKPIQDQMQMYRQIGSSIAEGYSLVKELLAKDSNSLENLQRTAELQPDTRDPLARLQQATGMELSSGSRDALEYLSQVSGMDRPDALLDISQTLNQSPVQEIAPALEPVIEEHELEQSIAMIFEL